MKEDHDDLRSLGPVKLGTGALAGMPVYSLPSRGSVSNMAAEDCARPLVRVKRLHPDAVLPRYQTDGAAAFDLSAVSFSALRHPNGDEAYGFQYGTGLAFEIPAGHVGLVTLRSSLGKAGWSIPNAPGVIDSDYRGEVHVTLVYPPGLRPGFAPHPPIGRIAQMLIVPVAQAQLVEAYELSETKRGVGGFGSTGR